MSEAKQKLLLVGCGKMGGALLRGIIAARLVSEIVVVEPSPKPDDLKSLASLQWLNNADAIAASFVPDVVLIAIKPQMINDALPLYARFTGAVFLSIAAGKTIASLTAALNNPSASVVRTMPNLPASIGQGVTVAVSNSHVSAQQRDICDRLLRAVGLTAWIQDETLLDVVTAVSGSGPAYVFALCEAMAKAGEKMGLPADMAQQLARQTIIGSGALMAASSDSAADLRKAVTSPKGTTEAALKYLQAENNGLDDLMQKTMAACAARAKELAQ